jgi:hypothetical protein
MRRATVPYGVSDILYGETPFGWRLSRDRARLVVDGDEQRVIAVARHMYFVRRIPMRDIVQELEAMRLVNRRGRPFGLSSVWQMIHRGKDRPAEASPPNAKAKPKPKRVAARRATTPR